MVVSFEPFMHTINGALETQAEKKKTSATIYQKELLQSYYYQTSN